MFQNSFVVEVLAYEIACIAALESQSITALMILLILFANKDIFIVRISSSKSVGCCPAWNGMKRVHIFYFLQLPCSIICMITDQYRWSCLIIITAKKQRIRKVFIWMLKNIFKQYMCEIYVYFISSYVQYIKLSIYKKQIIL